MPLDTAKARKHLAASSFKPLFIEELGWNRYSARLEVPVSGQVFELSAIAEKHGMIAFVCSAGPEGRIPDYQIRRKIERQITKTAHEHIIVFVDANKSAQIWQWLRREKGKPAVCREHIYQVGQPGDSLVQKLNKLAISLEEEESLTLLDVTGRARKAFDVERVTKRFYDRFKEEHATFLKFLEGIPDEEMERWYVSVMLNRLMFIYFIQKKGFLGSDSDYLKNKLSKCRRELGKDHYYQDFLCPLFFEGFAKKNEDRSDKAKRLLGEVPYLNGGIFLPHQIEQLHGKTIKIPDRAFERLFAFFDAYRWHLDERPLRKDNEINPDVLGYIFEKYINQKQMGAYYTKEDITEYISRNTVIPYLLDAARAECKGAFEGDHSVWHLLCEDPDRYIHPPIKKGLELTLPKKIEAGLADVSERQCWNGLARGEYALPTEIWREVILRRKHYEEVARKLAAGEIRSVTDLITYNLDIRQFTQDIIECCEGPELLVASWKAIQSITVLDPTCGSGAFLFAALNILEPIYEACLERMEFFLKEWGKSGQKNHPNYHKFFVETLRRMEEHPNHRYFIFKSIIVNNLYGVDIMEEAVEICKLRLFLKLVAQIDSADDIEPLPDIDFNIRAGNTLVGFTSLDDVHKTQEGTLGFGANDVARIEEKAEIANRAFRVFHEMQTSQGVSASELAAAKEDLRSHLKKLNDELDMFLAGEYGVPVAKRDSFKKWRKSHQPFHWFAEFHGILKAGGFNVVIGNPPFVEYSVVKKEYAIVGFKTEECGNLYSFIAERSHRVLCHAGRIGLIMPLSGFSTGRMAKLQELFQHRQAVLCVSYFSGDANPSRLFEGVKFRLSIVLAGPKETAFAYFSTRYLRWYSEERPTLFSSFRYFDATTCINSDSMPKIGSEIIAGLLREIRSQSRLNHYITKHGQQLLYHNCPVNWIRATTFAPAFKSARDGVKISTQLHTLCFRDSLYRDAACCVLNSSLFFLHWLLYSDCYHLTNRELLEFGIDLDQLVESRGKDLAAICRRLMSDYAANSRKRRYVYKTSGEVIYDEFYPKHSKTIIDEIDRILAKHYGFSDEQLDFIINYDIKYRMGQESEDGTEESYEIKYRKGQAAKAAEDPE